MQPSDKIESGYWKRYLERFEGFEPASILELGVLEGASLDLWHECFPKAQVVGIDRDPPFCSTEPDAPWRTYRCEQDDVVMLGYISDAHHGWNLIVDDCAHEGALSMASFHALWPRLRSGGCYVVEDWGTGYWKDWPDHGSGHSMVDFVKALVDLIDDNGTGLPHFGIRSVEFVPGQVFVWKT